MSDTNDEKDATPAPENYFPAKCKMVIPRYSRNLTLAEILDNSMVEQLVHNNDAQLELLPSRHKAKMVFNRYFDYLISRGVNAHKPCTNANIYKALKEVYRQEPRRFKFRILRGYLLYRPDTEDNRRYIYRIHYSSQNTRWQLRGENQAGWCTINTQEDFERYQSAVLTTSVYENLTVPTTSWNVREMLYFDLQVRSLMGARMGLLLHC